MNAGDLCVAVLRAVDRACPANLDNHRGSPANPLLQRCQPFKRGVRQRTLLDRGERILELLRRRHTGQDGAHHRMRDRKPPGGFREARGKPLLYQGSGVMRRTVTRRFARSAPSVGTFRYCLP